MPAHYASERASQRGERAGESASQLGKETDPAMGSSSSPLSSGDCTHSCSMYLVVVSLLLIFTRASSSSHFLPFPFGGGRVVGGGVVPLPMRAVGFTGRKRERERESTLSRISMKKGLLFLPLPLLTVPSQLS